MGVAPLCMELRLRMSFFVMGTVPDPHAHYSTGRWNRQGGYQEKRKSGNITALFLAGQSFFANGSTIGYINLFRVDPRHKRYIFRFEIGGRASL